MTLAFSYAEVPAATGPEAAPGAWAAWRGAGGIGLYDDTAIVIRAVAERGSGERTMHATARPDDAAPLAVGGIFALRWFEIAAADVDEFLALSVEAWPPFEAAFDAKIEGLFRMAADTDATRDGADMLLVTRYPSLAGWEASRGMIRGDNVAGRNFLRRRELTRRSMVRIAGPMIVPR